MERFRLNKVTGQIFQPDENSTGMNVAYTYCFCDVLIDVVVVVAVLRRRLRGRRCLSSLLHVTPVPSILKCPAQCGLKIQLVANECCIGCAVLSKKFL